MDSHFAESKDKLWPTYSVMPFPGKILATCIIVVMALGMLGALGQIVVHDIIPTFYENTEHHDNKLLSTPHDQDVSSDSELKSTEDRGDLFSELSSHDTKPKSEPFYKTEQFVWTLKWTHIHLFGMSMIFIFMGAVTLFLNAGPVLRSWLIILPFVGVIIDICAMWLKGFVSPVFFWLHIPGGGIFVLVFIYVSFRALWEMWIKPKHGVPSDLSD